MKKIWTLAVVAALGISTIGCGETTTPVKPVTPAAEVKPEGGEMKEEAKPEEKKEEAKPEEKKEEAAPPADAPK